MHELRELHYVLMRRVEVAAAAADDASSPTTLWHGSEQRKYRSKEYTQKSRQS